MNKKNEKRKTYVDAWPIIEDSVSEESKQSSTKAYCRWVVGVCR